MRACLIAILILTVGILGCSRRRQAPATQPAPPPSAAPPTITPPPPPPSQRVEDALPVPAEPALSDDGVAGRSLDDLNRNSPFKPVFFALDSSELDDAGRAVVTNNASLLKQYATWAITIEGHADERGTAEYNLALGERRAVAVRTYLVSLGVAPDRIRTVSYGKEFPFDAGHTESAWAQNRRAHFVITSK